MSAFMAIIFCPVCCSNTDVEGEGWQDRLCGDCGTSFKVLIDPSIVAVHSMS